MSDENKFFYANGVELAMTAFDVNLKFLRTGTQTVLQQQSGIKQASAVLQDEMVVGMSPQQAKLLVENLTNVLQAYEVQIGKLPDSEKLKVGMKAPAP